ncbi:MAG: sugar ABC transporter permease [Acidimicrobiales bacterium]
MSNQLLQVIIALVVGVGGIWLLYWGADRLVNMLPLRAATALRPWVFVGPALLLLTVYLVYPAINTIVLSFRDRRGQGWVGFDNYVDIFSDENGRLAIRNSIAWVVVVPVLAVAIGLAFAVLADKLGRRTEAAAKSVIFLPMAISFVGASIVWRFIYNFRPEGFGEQTGLLNAIWQGLGNNPVAWLLSEPWNNLYLMVIMIWLYTGFAMVVLSSAIKSLPGEVLEAARVDGATEWQMFWRIVLPMISSTVMVVLTTILIIVWKVFDIVFVMTGGEFGTTIVAERMITEFFTFRNQGRGAAFAVLLFVAVLPFMTLNIRRFRAQEEMR